ncbi:putative acid sphingomyelinase [Xylariaceae sp. FL0016]|nr:putative acid sphingomyelinase [Xylariaceae sp. FL0016]
MRVRPLLAAVHTACQAGLVAAVFDTSTGDQKPLQAGHAAGAHLLLDGLDDPDQLVAEVLADPTSPAACRSCEAALGTLKSVAFMGDAFFVGVTTELCTRFKIQDDDVCEGTISREGPIAAEALRRMKGSIMQRTCYMVLGLCQYPGIDEYEDLVKTPKPNATRPGTSGLEPLYVVHYSDIHTDEFYAEGAEVQCTKPICCRNYPVYDDTNTTLLRKAGPYGEHTCDSPLSLEKSMHEAIERLVPNASFTIFTGDIVDHAVWNTSEDQNTRLITDGYDRMVNANTPEVPVFGTAGNHESSPTNSYNPDIKGGWIYNVLLSAWSRWIGNRREDGPAFEGFYSVVHHNLRVISVNTNFYYAHNYWMYRWRDQDPSLQLAWLYNELEEAEEKGQQAYIIGHMPMGDTDCFHDHSRYFDSLVNRFSDTIAAMFFGHTHRDEFQISYANYSDCAHSNALATSYIAPSLTPTSGHPSFRVYKVDPVTYGVLDFTTYIANMSDNSFNRSPNWIPYYSAKEAYGPLVAATMTDATELTASFWHNVTEALERDEDAFADYRERRHRGWEEAVEKCEGECYKNEICKLRAGRSEDNCIVPGSVFHRKMERPSNSSHVECGVNVIRDTLGGMMRRPEMLTALREMVDEM